MTIIRAIFALPVLALTLAACQSTLTTAQNATAGGEVALTQAEIVAKQYTDLPRCPVADGLCSDPATVKAIGAADNAAYTAVKAAEAGTGTAAQAAAAIATLTATVPSK